MKTILNLLLTTILLTAVLLTANAQENDGDWRKYLDLWGEIEDVEGSEWETAEEVMSELAAHPININTATREDLQQLPFLSEKEIEDLAEYVHRYAPLRSLGELAMIPSLSYEKREMLRHFLYIGQEEAKGFPDWKEVFKYGGHSRPGCGGAVFCQQEQSGL